MLTEIVHGMEPSLLAAEKSQVTFEMRCIQPQATTNKTANDVHDYNRGSDPVLVDCAKAKSR